MNKGKKKKKVKKDHTIVYMDISVNRKMLGRLIIKLFDKIVPRTVHNFVSFINGYKGYGYENCKIHRIVPDFVIQGGDFTRGDGSGGFSVYGDKFEDEDFSIPHNQQGILSMANSGPNTNGSQFFITLQETPFLDNKHVAFGQVIDGHDVLDTLNNYGTKDGAPRGDVKIEKCGLM